MESREETQELITLWQTHYNGLLQDIAKIEQQQHHLSLRLDQLMQDAIEAGNIILQYKEALKNESVG